MQPLPTSQEFLRGIDTAYRTDEMWFVAALLDEYHSPSTEKVLQALRLCDIYKHCVAFASRTDADIAPPPTVQTRRRSGNVALQQTAPALSTAPTVPTAFRRSNAMVISNDHMQRHEHTKFQRQLAIHNVKSRATHQLCVMFGCVPGQLQARIAERFESVLSGHGITVDTRDKGKLRLLGDVERATRKIVFWGGRAHMLTEKEGLLQQVPADTSRHYDGGQSAQMKKHRFWCAGYVFTGTDLYMDNHRRMEPNADQEVFYHSSYLGGAPVVCAGDISFLDGQCTSISNLSGHYKPPARSLVQLIRYLKLNQMNIDGAQVSLAEDEPNASLGERSALSPDQMHEPHDVYGNDYYFGRTVQSFLAGDEADFKG